MNIKFAPSRKKKLDMEKLQESFLKIPTVLDFFERIDIERLRVKNNEFTVLLDKDEFYLDNKDVNISAKLGFMGSQMIMDIYSIFVKDLNLTFWGRSKVDISKKIVNFFGEFNYLDMQGEINLQSTEDILDFYINSSKSISSLKFIKKFIRLDNVAEEWMYDNVDGKINLTYLFGKIDLNKQEPILNSIRGEAFIDDAKIRFNKNAKEVYTKKLKIVYKNDSLFFDFDEPIYNNKEKLYGSKVFITDLTSLKKGIVHVKLKSNSILNDDILGILKAYDIHLPIVQLDGELDSTLNLSVPYLASRKMDTDGTFKIRNANLKLNNFEFFSKEADVTLKDTMVYINNSSLKHKDLLDTKLKLDIDTKNLTAKGEGKINSFKVEGEKEEILNLNNISLPVSIDFKDKTKIKFDSLKTTLTINDKAIDVDIADLKTIYPYSQLLKEAEVSSGNLSLKVFDENNIEFNGELKDLQYPLEKDGQLIKSLNIKGIVKEKNTHLKDEDLGFELIVENKKKTLIKLKGIDINLEKSKSFSSGKLPNIDLELENASIILDDKHIYKTENAKVYLNDSLIEFEGKASNIDLPISKNGKKIESLDVMGSFFNNVFNIQSLDGLLKLKYEVDKEKVTMNLNGYDVLYNTNKENDEDELNINYNIKGINSNVIINNKYIAKAKFYEFNFNKDNTNINLHNDKIVFFYSEDKSGNIVLEAKNMNDDFLNSLINKRLVKGGKVNISASGKNRLIQGTVDIKEAKIVDLAILNNLIILINTSPGLINPLLAIPSVVNMAASDGFNLNGYRVNEGNIEFSYNLDEKFLSMNKIKTKGNGIDFDGYANIDFDTSKIDSKLKLIFFKSYSKVVGAIPVLNYILLGDQKRVDTEVTIYGTLENPEYKTALAQEGMKAPVNFIKRVITSPLKVIESIGDSLNGDKEKEKKTEEKK